MQNDVGRINSLQWLRFLAAISVMVYHAAVYLQIMRADPIAVGVVPSWLGALGVSIFFALSGFLMAGAMTRQDAATFLLHRIARIYPAFLIAVGLFYASFVFSPIRTPFDWTALTLMPVGEAIYPLGVEWTLIFEVGFYVFLFLVILFGLTKDVPAIMTGWLGLICIHNILIPDDPSKNLFSPLTLPFVGVNVAFAAGALMKLTWERQMNPVLAGILGVAFWLLGSRLLGVMGARWGMGVGSALLVLSVARYHGARFLVGKTPLGQLGNRLGDYSYALYLVHVPVIRTAYALLPEDIGGATLFWIASSLALLFAVPMGEIDLHLYRFLKRQIDEAGQTFKQLITLAYASAFAAMCLVGIVNWP